MLERLSALVSSPEIVERALQKARDNCATPLVPQREALSRTQSALRQNQVEIDRLLITITTGGATDALLAFFNQRAKELQTDRDQLMKEQRRLQLELAPSEYELNAQTFHGYLSDFKRLAEAAEPQELQTLLRLTVKRMEWGPDGKHKVQFYPLPFHKHKNQRPPLPDSDEPGSEGRWFDLNRCAIAPVGVEPTLSCENWILSPARLPIPPQSRVGRDWHRGHQEILPDGNILCKSHRPLQPSFWRNHHERHHRNQS